MSGDVPSRKVKLNWKGADHSGDPFAALSGHQGERIVTEATCSARSDAELDDAVGQLVERTALLARRLVARADRVLFLWDPVYSELSIVFTDLTMYVDGPLVTQCKFPMIDEAHSSLARLDEDKWDLETAQFSQRLRELIAIWVSRVKFPWDTDVYFSDQNRESFSPEEFQAARVSSAWRSR